MATVLKSKPGLSSTTTLNIPTTWDATWFRNFISNQLKGADVRNAIGANGITVSGSIASPYATISGAGLINSVVGTANEIAVSTVAGVSTISLAPNNIVPTPSSGVALSVFGAANSVALNVVANGTANESFGATIAGGTSSSDYALDVTNAAGSVGFFLIRGDGGILIGNPAGGDNGVGTLNIQNGLYLSGVQIYSGVPQNEQNGNYTLALSDEGKHIYNNTGTATTKTIPANSSIPFPVGTQIMFYVEAGGTSMTLAITTDTLRWSPTNATGSRTLAPGAVATILKIASTLWILWGVGIT